MPNFFDGLGELTSALVYFIYGGILVGIFVLAPYNIWYDGTSYPNLRRTCLTAEDHVSSEESQLRSLLESKKFYESRFDTAYYTSRSQDLAEIYQKLRQNKIDLKRVKVAQKEACYTNDAHVVYDYNVLTYHIYYFMVSYIHPLFSKGSALQV
ncbi:hypothetical protein LCGC14_1261960 [marine sediment metagenome]|uniref:Uncharacterized protein n=1 Tax=marine sediment metagenome TaxID=412755 RepID=A0A0F9L0D8_9ZZZZ